MTELGTVVLVGENGIRISNAPRAALDSRVEDAMAQSGLLLSTDGFQPSAYGPFRTPDNVIITMLVRPGVDTDEVIELFAAEVDKVIVMFRDFQWVDRDLVLANAPLEARDVRVEDALNRSGFLTPGGFQVKTTGPTHDPDSVTIIMTPKEGLPDEVEPTDKVRQVPLENSMAARWLLIREIERLVTTKATTSS